jgi:hypothetical protein
MRTITVNDSTTAATTTCAPLPTRESSNSARTMNRRDMLRLSLAAALMGTVTNPNEAQATQTVAAKPVSLPELPPEPPKDIAAKLFPGFVQTEVRTSGAIIPVLHKGDGPPVRLNANNKPAARSFLSGERRTYAPCFICA